MSTLDAPQYCYRHPDRETGLSCSECDRPICYECMTPAPVGLRCPEHSGKAQGIQKVMQPAQRAVTGIGSSRMNMATMVLIGMNVFVYLAELAAGGSQSGDGNWLFSHGALVVNGVTQGGRVGALPAHTTIPGLQVVGVAHGEWWRLLTAAFLHAGIFHLLVNMISLYFVGTLLEHVIGRWRFLLLYFTAAVAGSAGAILLSPNQVTLGASGAIFGGLGALLVLERRRMIASGGQIAGWIVFNLVLTFAVANISIGGHIGGLLCGIVVMWLILEARRSVVRTVGAAVAAAAISIAIAYSKVRGYQ